MSEAAAQAPAPAVLPESHQFWCFKGDAVKLENVIVVDGVQGQSVLVHGLIQNYGVRTVDRAAFLKQSVPVNLSAAPLL